MKENKKKNFIDMGLLSIIVFTGFLGCIFAPCEMYIVNHNEFWFDLASFWWIPVLVFLLMGIIAYLVGILLPEKIRSFYKAFILGIGLCVYVQGNFLNIDVGIMNGREIAWDSYKEAFRNDLIIWILIMVLVFVFNVLKKDSFAKISKYVALFMTGMLFLTFIILLVTHSEAIGSRSEGKYFTDKDAYTISSAKGNIVVFLLDTLDDRYIKDMIKEDWYGLESLDGFTYFNNNTGTYTTTACSVAHLMTGKTYRNEMDLFEWVDSFNDEELYMDRLIDSGYDIYMYSGMKPSIPDKYADAAKNIESGRLVINNHLHFTYDIYQLVMCKYFPDILKPYIWMDGTEFNAWKSTENGSTVYSDNDLVYYNALCNNGLTKTDSTNKEFKYVYLWGAHFPVTIDENVESVGKVSYSYESGYKCAKGCMNIVFRYMEYLKEADAYDNTAIIILADHGNNNDGRLLHNPAFLVKPVDSHGELVINDAPVCQEDYGATILQLAGIDYSGFGKSVFDIEKTDTRQRYYYQYYETIEDQYMPGPYRLIEYSIDPDDNSVNSFHLTDVEYTYTGEKIRHSDYCRICNGDIASEESKKAVLEENWHEKTSDYPVGDAKLRYLSE